MRVQRTRSSPSALRSPLTRHPLGRFITVLVASWSIACASASDSCPETTGGQLEFFAGEAARLEGAGTFAVAPMATGAEITRLEKAVVSAIRRRIPRWRYETDQTKADVTIELSSVECMICVDCDHPEYSPRWVSAEVVVDHGLARAKWSLATYSRSDKGLIDELAKALARSANGKAA